VRHRPVALAPTWRPPALAEWTAPGGPLHPGLTLDQALRVEAGAGPERVVLVDGPRRWSSSELEDRVAGFAAAVAAQGVVRGDVVGWQLPNCAEAVLLLRTCWRLGATAAPLHHLAGPAEVEALRRRLAPDLFLDHSAATSLPGPEAGPGRGPGLGAQPERAPEAAADPGDVAVVLHTSGSTGTPKGVLFTHRALAYKARQMARLHELGPSDVVLMPAPLAHVSGLLNGVLVPGVVPFRSVLMARWSPEAALELIEAEGVTFMVGPPTFFLGLMAAEGFSPARVASLRLLSVGGAGVTPEFVERAADAFGAVVKRTYGATEAPTTTTSHGPTDPEERAGFDGRVVPHARLRVVVPGTLAELPPDTEGEVLVSGPELFSGYLDPERNHDAVEDDWFRTGDLGVLDDQGRLRITGRLKDVIIRGGENISAAEVEGHLGTHPAVEMAVAVGEPDERLGERVCAVVQLVAGAAFDLETCRQWFHQRGVARFLTPERIVVVDRMPLLASGKADRAAAAARSRSSA
jgi:cyclohexanecarboxylate-CoA ligase